MEIFSVNYALLAVQSALLEKVTPELRAVIVDVSAEDFFMYIFIYHDGKASEEMIDLWLLMTAEASADLGINCKLDQKIYGIDEKNPIRWHRGYFAYLRKERLAGKILADFYKKVPSVYEKPSVYSMSSAQLAIQKALLGIVTPALRVVFIDVPERLEEEPDPIFYIQMCHHGELSEELRLLWEKAMAQACQEMGSEYILKGEIQRIDEPEDICYSRGLLVYCRKEINSSSFL